MNASEAAARLRLIHEQLAKSEVYRGYSPPAVALSGVLGLLAAAAQPWLVEAADEGGYLLYWLTVGICCGLIAMSPTLYLMATTTDAGVYRRSLTVTGQFLPCLLAGATVTFALSRPLLSAVAVPLLPGLWAVLFALGIVACRPYLPPSCNWVAGWYLLAGLFLLLSATGPLALSGWAVGVPFGLGQLGAALVFQVARRPGVSP